MGHFLTLLLQITRSQPPSCQRCRTLAVAPQKWPNCLLPASISISLLSHVPHPSSPRLGRILCAFDHSVNLGSSAPTWNSFAPFSPICRVAVRGHIKKGHTITARLLWFTKFGKQTLTLTEHSHIYYHHHPCENQGHISCMP